jgi:hypothetical protein
MDRVRDTVLATVVARASALVSPVVWRADWRLALELSRVRNSRTTSWMATVKAA